MSDIEKLVGDHNPSESGLTDEMRTKLLLIAAATREKNAINEPLDLSTRAILSRLVDFNYHLTDGLKLK